MTEEASQAFPVSETQNESQTIITKITKEKNDKKVEAGKKGAETRKKLRDLKQSADGRKTNRAPAGPPSGETHSHSETFWHTGGIPALVFGVLLVGSGIVMTRYWLHSSSPNERRQTESKSDDQVNQLKDREANIFEL